MAAPGANLRPLRFGEVLDRAFKLYANSYRRLLPAVLLVVIPVQLLAGLILLSSYPDPDLLQGQSTLTDEELGELVLYLAGLGVGLLLTGLSTLVLTAALVRGYGSAYLGQPAGWRDSLSVAFRRFWALLLMSFLLALALFAGALVCGIGIVFPYTVFSVAYAAVVIERLGGAAALGRSWNLVISRFWWVLGLQVVVFLIVTFASGFVLVAPTVISFVAPEAVVAFVVSQTVCSIIAYVVTTPFSAAVTTVLYFDLRVKNEGFDMQLLAQSLGAAGAPPPVPQQPPPPPAPA